MWYTYGEIGAELQKGKDIYAEKLVEQLHDETAK